MAAPAPSAPPLQFTLPPPAPPPAFHMACSADRETTRNPHGTSGVITYDFATIDLHPLRRGPRASERSHASIPRSLEQIDALLDDRRATITQCWKWASARGAVASHGTLAFAIEPNGRTTDVAVELEGHPEPELARCVTEQLAGRLVDSASPRTTRVRLPIEFGLADQPRPWPSPPARPSPPSAQTRAGCVAVLDDPAPDVLVTPLATAYSDWDRTRERSGVIVDTFGGCPHSIDRPTKHDLIAAFSSNTGAYGACYADYLARSGASMTAGADTAAAIRLVFHGGTVVATEVTGVGDEPLHRCFAEAAREVWLDRANLDTTTVANFSLALLPADAAAPDPYAALGQLAAEIVRTPRPTPATACALHASILAQYALIAPWLADPRVRRAIDDLVASARPLPQDEAVACLAPVADLLRMYALPLNISDHWNWTSRMEAVTPIAGALPFGAELRKRYAEQLALTPRRTEALALLRALASTDEERASVDLLVSKDHLTGCGLL